MTPKCTVAYGVYGPVFKGDLSLNFSGCDSLLRQMPGHQARPFTSLQRLRRMHPQGDKYMWGTDLLGHNLKVF